MHHLNQSSQHPTCHQIHLINLHYPRLISIYNLKPFINLKLLPILEIKIIIKIINLVWIIFNQNPQSLASVPLINRGKLQLITVFVKILANFWSNLIIEAIVDKHWSQGLKLILKTVWLQKKIMFKSKHRVKIKLSGLQ